MRCQGCGKCCKNLSLTKEEFQQLLEDFPELCQDFSDYQFAFELKGRCPFLSDENRCVDYEHRPRVCRMFPVVVYGQDQNGIIMEASHFCPNASTVTPEIWIAKMLFQDYKSEMTKNWQQYQDSHPDATQMAVAFLGSESQNGPAIEENIEPQNPLVNEANVETLENEDPQIPPIAEKTLSNLIVSYEKRIKRQH